MNPGLPVFKDGNGKELRHLNVNVQQHLRAPKVMEYEPYKPFITSILELKLDVSPMFEWQKHSQGSISVPRYHVIFVLKFLRHLFLITGKKESCI